MPLERIFNLTFQLNGWFMRNFFCSPKNQIMYTIEISLDNKQNKCIKNNRNVIKSLGKNFLLILSLSMCVSFLQFSHQRFFLCHNQHLRLQQQKISWMCGENKYVKRNGSSICKKRKTEMSIVSDLVRFFLLLKVCVCVCSFYCFAMSIIFMS